MASGVDANINTVTKSGGTGQIQWDRLQIYGCHKRNNLLGFWLCLALGLVLISVGTLSQYC